MNRDFHYYGTYIAARIANFEHKDAMTIAYAAQYVDESNAGMIDSELDRLLGEGRKAQPTVETTQEDILSNLQPNSWTNDQRTNRQRIWMAFHFLPGNFEYSEKYEGKAANEKELFRLLCTSNSKTVEFMIKNTREHYNSLELIGLRMHVLADTWSHMYYIGTASGINDAGKKVEEFYNNKWNNLSFSTCKPFTDDKPEKGEYFATPIGLTYEYLNYLGHGRMGHLPDYPFIHYRYSPNWKSSNSTETGKIIYKNNQMDCINAFKQMVYALQCIKNYKPFELEKYEPNFDYEDDIAAAKEKWAALVAKLQAIISNNRVIDQSAAWSNLIKDLKLHVNKGVPEGLKISDFNKDEWYNEFKQAKDDSSKKKTSYYLFNKAAVEHVEAIERFLNNDASEEYKFSFKGGAEVTKKSQH